MGDMRNKPSVGISPAKSTKIPAKGTNSQVGSTAVWDGPHKPKGPFIKGSSNGADGIALLDILIRALWAIKLCTSSKALRSMHDWTL